MRLPHRLLAAFASAGVAVSAPAASFDDRVEALFRPLLGEMIALSPDGQRVAYTQQTGDELVIVMMNVELPGPKRTVKVDPDRAPSAPPPAAAVGAAAGAAPVNAPASDAPVAPVAPAAPMRLRFLRWGAGGRIVFAPVERVVPLPPVADKHGRLTPNPDGPVVHAPIFVADPDKRERGTLIDAKQFQETPADARRSLADLLRTTKQLEAAHNAPVRWRMPHLDILGFLPRERDQLIVQTRGAYSMPMQHLVDTRTGSVREFGTDWPAPPGEPQVFDPFRLKVVGERKDAARPTTAWRDEDFARIQRELEAKFPRRIVEILDWSETRARVLFRVTGGSDAGRFFVFQRPEDLVVEVLRCAPWLGAAKLHETRFFEFATGDGARLSGYVTWPTKPKVTPPPLLVVFPSGFPGRAQPAFDPEAQLFADSGFAVLRLNHRGVATVRPQDLNALRAAVDRVSVDDARAALEWLATQHADRRFDRGRVVTLGRGFGGYLAVRALQLQPGVFRCGLAFDAPLELRAWLQPPAMPLGAMTLAPAAPAVRDIPAALIDHAGTEWKKLSVLEQADALTAPVLLLVEPGRNAAVDACTGELRARLQAIGRAPEHIELDAGFAAARPASCAAVYRRIEEFLNLHLHGYAVNIGPVKEVQ